MFSEKLTRYYTGDDSHLYMAMHAGSGARRKAYAQYKELKQWWNDSVDDTNEQGGVDIVANTGVSPANYQVSVRLTDPNNVVLFRLRFEYVDKLPR